MSAHPIRFPDDLWEAICVEAQHVGLPAGEFVREAATARMAIARERRLSGTDVPLSALYEAAHEYLLSAPRGARRP